MALTTTEEALVRQLLDQQAAILSLAGNEATITSKLGATKVTLADLLAANSLADADLLLTRQGTTDKSVRADILAAYMAASSTFKNKYLASSSETAPGIIELATAAEVAAGTDTTRAVTPAGLKSHLGSAATRNVGTSAGTVAAGDDPRFNTYAVKSNNLSDLTDKQQAIQNLGLQLPLGQGQTWQDVAGSRSYGITYTNTTGRAIAVSIEEVSDGVKRLTVNGVVVAANLGSNYDSTFFAIVPAGATYVFSGGFGIWAELR